MIERAEAASLRPRRARCQARFAKRRASHRPATAGPAIAPPRRRRGCSALGAARVKRRKQAEQDAGRKRGAGAMRKHAKVWVRGQGDVVANRAATLARSGNRARCRPPTRRPQATGSREQLPHDGATSAADRNSRRDFASTSRRARQQQAGDVDAADEQHDQDGGPQHQQRLAYRVRRTRCQGTRRRRQMKSGGGWIRSRTSASPIVSTRWATSVHSRRAGGGRRERNCLPPPSPCVDGRSGVQRSTGNARAKAVGKNADDDEGLAPKRDGAADDGRIGMRSARDQSE